MNYKNAILTINRNKCGDRKETLRVYDDGYIQYFYSSNRCATESEPQLLSKTNPQEICLIMRKLSEKIDKIEKENNILKMEHKRIKHLLSYVKDYKIPEDIFNELIEELNNYDNT